MFISQLSEARILVITNCTSRKRSRSPALTPPSITPRSRIEALAASWVRLASAGSSSQRAGDLYIGRSAHEAKRAAEEVHGTLYFVSAGFGLVTADAELPNYSLTITDGGGSIRPLLESWGLGPCAWWRALNTELGVPAPIAKAVSAPATETALIALPSSYLLMVGDELAALPEQLRARLRIFTSRAGLSAVPQALRTAVLPYDERLESIAGYAGTKADFPQRALRHFVREVHRPGMPIAEERQNVLASLRSQSPRVPVARTRATDQEISALLRANWDSQQGSSSRLLRFLRDEAKVACEQKRFRGLWQSVEASRSVKDGHGQAAQ